MSTLNEFNPEDESISIRLQEIDDESLKYNLLGVISFLLFYIILFSPTILGIFLLFIISTTTTCCWYLICCQLINLSYIIS